MGVIGDRGFVINEADGSFSYVTEDSWRATQAYSVADSTPVSSALGSVFQRIQNSVFVDLDLVADLPETIGSATALSRAPGAPLQELPAEPSIIVKELDKLYVLPRSSWTPSDVTIASEALVAINRNVQLKSIPSGNIPAGTFCVLVNIKAMP